MYKTTAEKIKELDQKVRDLLNNIKILSTTCIGNHEPLYVVHRFLQEKALTTMDEYVDLFVPIYGDFESRTIIWRLLDNGVITINLDRKIEFNGRK